MSISDATEGERSKGFSIEAQRVIDVNLSRRADAPLYLRLASELRLLIKTGALGPGARLPSVQHLGAHLGINRNTVHHAYSVLISEGLLTGRRGGGTLVADSTIEVDRQSPGLPIGSELFREMVRLIHLAEEQGLSAHDLASTIEQYSPRGQGQGSPLRVGVVECNPDSLSYYSAELQKEFGAAVTPMLLGELPVLRRDDAITRLDCIVSTYFHLSEVRRLLLDMPALPEIFAIGVRPHLSVLTELESLPRDSTVGVAYYDSGHDPFVGERLTRMVDMVRHSNIRHVKIEPFLLRGKPRRWEFASIDVLLVRPENIRPIRQFIPKELRTIEFVNQLDDATREFLREVFVDMRDSKPPTQESPDRPRGVDGKSI